MKKLVIFALMFTAQNSIALASSSDADQVVKLDISKAVLVADNHGGESEEGMNHESEEGTMNEEGSMQEEGSSMQEDSSDSMNEEASEAKEDSSEEGKKWWQFWK